jgi:hypothetical protein
MTGEVTLPEASPCLACGMIQERRKKEGTTEIHSATQRALLQSMPILRGAKFNRPYLNP